MRVILDTNVLVAALMAAPIGVIGIYVALVVWIVLLVTVGFGAIGWVDDYRKVVHNNPKGLSARKKIFWQSVIGLVAALYLVFSISENSNLRVLELFVSWVQSGFSNDLPPKADLIVPFFKTISYPLGVFGFISLTYFVIVGASNAVNLTDGLDGLAIGCTIIVSIVTAETRDAAIGGDAPTECGHYKWFVPITAGWQNITLDFATDMVEPWNKAACPAVQGVATDKIVGIDFGVDAGLRWLTEKFAQ